MHVLEVNVYSYISKVIPSCISTKQEKDQTPAWLCTACQEVTSYTYVAIIDSPPWIVLITRFLDFRDRA